MPNPWDAQHLVMLIGTNPLPNYVTARYLLDQAPGEKPRVWYVCTVETRGVCDRLDGELQIRGERIVLSNPYSPRSVQADIETKLQELERSNDVVHLNYTGGTKVMSVETVLAAVEGLSDQLMRSYLDPRDFKLHVVGGSGSGSYPASGDLRDVIKLPLQAILELHDCGLLENNRPEWPRGAVAMLDFMHTMKTPHSLGPFNAWRDEEIDVPWNTRSRKEFLEACGTWANSRKHPFEWQTHRALEKLSESQRAAFASIPEAIRSHESPFVDKAPAAWGTNFDQRSKMAARFVHFIRGGWLEELVAAACRSHKEWGNVSVNKGAIHRDAPANRGMELDVVILRGYALTLLSCTSTYKEGQIKSKSFEAIHRAQQLGGDEANAIVICLADDGKLQDLWSDLATYHSGRLPLRFVSWQGLVNTRGEPKGLETLLHSLEGVATRRKDSKGNEVKVF